MLVRLAADQGLGEAKATMMLYDGYVAKNVVKGFDPLLQSLDQGDSITQWLLGECYEDGKGVEEDVVKAVEWYRKAAEQGNTDAQFCLGECYYTGDGVEKDLVKATKWYRKAAEQGAIDAQDKLNALTIKEHNKGRSRSSEY
jgi:TPR repeat protein